MILQGQKSTFQVGSFKSKQNQRYHTKLEAQNNLQNIKSQPKYVQRLRLQAARRGKASKVEGEDTGVVEKEERRVRPKANQEDSMWYQCIDDINKKHGKATIETFEEDTTSIKVETLPSGILLLDWALGGGYRKGGVIEIFGNEATGKSTLALQCCAEVHKRGGKTLYVDAEFAFNEQLAKNMGVEIENKEKFAYHTPDYGERALEIVERFAKSNVCSLIVVDSVAALIPKNEASGDLGSPMIGSQSRMMSSCLKRIVQSCNATKCVVVFINQTRNKIGVLYGNPETTTGGKALSFYAAQRVRISKLSGSIVKDKKEVGINVKAKVVKNKIGNPNNEVEFAILWGHGVDNSDQLVDLCEKTGVIERRGAFYYLEGEQLERGKEALKNKIRGDPILFEQLNKLSSDALQNKSSDEPLKVVSRNSMLDDDEFTDEDDDTPQVSYDEGDLGEELGLNGQDLEEEEQEIEA